jgi:DNA-binding CsgD family transcriptional regulator
MDPDLHGVGINVPSAEPIQLSRKAREHWQMLAVHFAAGHRLRRSLGQGCDAPGVPVTELPLNAEALLDPKRFLVSHRAGDARGKTASEAIRQAAVRVDRARGKARKSDPERAIRLWEGLVRGRWSLVDWFDTDGRRFVLAIPNAPNLGDPRSLSKREHQVATYAALGESNKTTGYRLGLSPPRISALLNSAMRKFGVKTKAQLVMKMRGLLVPSNDP